MIRVFNFFTEATDVPEKTTNLTKGQEGYLKANITTDFNSILTDDMNYESVKGPLCPRNAFIFPSEKLFTFNVLFSFQKVTHRPIT
jgi:hypothetical protein